MNFYAATIIELLIIEAFVFFIWFKVLLEAVRSKDGTLVGKKILLTSIGLVFNSIAIVGIMSFRIWELIVTQKPFAWSIIAMYVVLALGGILFMVSAALVNNARLIKSFVGVTFVWTLVAIYLGSF